MLRLPTCAPPGLCLTPVCPTPIDATSVTGDPQPRSVCTSGKEPGWKPSSQRSQRLQFSGKQRALNTKQQLPARAALPWRRRAGRRRRARNPGSLAFPSTSSRPPLRSRLPQVRGQALRSEPSNGSSPPALKPAERGCLGAGPCDGSFSCTSAGDAAYPQGFGPCVEVRAERA